MHNNMNENKIIKLRSGRIMAYANSLSSFIDISNNGLIIQPETWDSSFNFKGDVTGLDIIEMYDTTDFLNMNHNDRYSTLVKLMEKEDLSAFKLIWKRYGKSAILYDYKRN